MQETEKDVRTFYQNCQLVLVWLMMPGYIVLACQRAYDVKQHHIYVSVTSCFGGVVLLLKHPRSTAMVMAYM